MPNETNKRALVAETITPASSDPDAHPWKVIIADEEQDIHKIIAMALQRFSFDGRPLEFFSAYSCEQAKCLTKEHPDTAIVILGVRMETENVGLDVARYIREELGNKLVRIILIAKQPGNAIERRMISEYDINDCKEKTELTAEKLFTSITSSLRTFRDLGIIEKNRKGLTQVINSSSRLFENLSLRKFAKAMLTQLISILNLDEGSFYRKTHGFAVTEKKGDLMIMAATGKFEKMINQPIAEIVPDPIRQHLDQAINEKQSIYVDNAFVVYFSTKHRSDNLLYLQGCGKLSELDKHLIQIFSTNAAIAFENIYLNKEVVDTIKEVVVILGEVLETRSMPTGKHVRRVGEIARLLALKYGLDAEEAELLKLASCMHDVGKVGVADAVLLKPNRLTSEEFAKLERHTTIGYEILKKSTRKIIQAAAIVAHQHHEKWDGTGYPQGLKEDEIHIYARITGIADVFDALAHKRVYKPAWDIESITDYFINQRGKHFDPVLVNLFIKNINEFAAITQQYRDQETLKDKIQDSLEERQPVIIKNQFKVA